MTKMIGAPTHGNFRLQSRAKPIARSLPLKLDARCTDAPYVEQRPDPRPERPTRLTVEQRIDLMKRRRLFWLAESHAEANGCDLEEVLGDSRRTTVSRARHEVAAVLYEAGQSLEDVAELIGRDQSTVRNSVIVCGVKLRLKCSGKVA